MERSKTAIPYYTDINEFLASIPWPGRTTNPNFYCLRLKKSDQQVKIYRPPFKRSFYFFALFINSGKARIDYNNTTVEDPEAYLVFHSPGLVYSFSHNHSLEGYVIYFKSECFSFFKPDFHKEFPFFDLLHTDLFKLDHATFEELAPHFEEVFTTYERSSKKHHLQARIKLLALLYYMKEFTLDRKKEARFATSQQILEEGVKIISTFWGNPDEIVKIAHQANAIVIHTAGSAEEAKDAIGKGVDIIVGQGWEAGGHVYGTVSLQTLIPAILDTVPGFPVTFKEYKVPKKSSSSLLKTQKIQLKD